MCTKLRLTVAMGGLSRAAVLLLAITFVPMVAMAEDSERIKKLENQVETLAQQVEQLTRMLGEQRQQSVTRQDLEQVQRQVEQAATKQEVEELQTEVNQNAEFRFADSVVHLAGYGSARYVDGDEADSSFGVGSFNPIFHFQYKDLVLLEAEFEFEIEDDGSTKTELEYLTVDLLLHDYVTLLGGKFLSPVGYFRQNLHPAWINKLPSAPIGFGHDQAAPVAEVGFQARGGLPLPADMRLNYAIYGGNGPRLEVEDGEIEAVETEGFGGDDNSNKVVGGRIGFRPLPKLEIGISGVTGQTRVAGDADRDYDVIDVDFNLTGLDFAPGLDIRGEFVTTYLGEGGVLDPEKKRWSAWYLQAAYLMPWFPVEGVVRYGEFDFPTDQHEQWVFGINYLFANQLIAKAAYETNDFDLGVDEDRWLVELAFGF